MAAKKNKAKKPMPQKRKKATRVVAGVSPRSILSDHRAAEWEALLRDPCAGKLVPPCYAGLDNGYLVRTTDILTPLVANVTTAGDGKADAVFQFTPFNYSSTTGYLGAVNVAGSALAALVANSPGPNNFITTSAVKRFRPVAGCIKFIPIGSYSLRSGVIGSAVLPGMEVVNGQVVTVDNAMALCQHYAAVGAEPHEVRWLPTAIDENFTDVNTANSSAAGSVLFALKNVDAKFTGSQLVVSGYFELTLVWEWQPYATSSLSAPAQAPAPFTSQQVLSTIADFGKFVFHGINSNAYLRTAVSGAMANAVGLLTRGVMPLGSRYTTIQA